MFSFRCVVFVLFRTVQFVCASPVEFRFCLLCGGVGVTHRIHFLNFCNALLDGKCTSEELGIIERLSGSRRTNLANVEINECVRLSALPCQ